MDRSGKERRHGPDAERAERERRLARALRDNLRRRKEQARGKVGGDPETASERKGKPDNGPGSG